MLRNTYLILSFWVLACACGTEAQQNTPRDTVETPPQASVAPVVQKARIITPARDTLLTLGDPLPIRLDLGGDNGAILRYQLNGAPVQSVSHEDGALAIETRGGNVGENSLSLQIRFTDSTQERLSYRFELLSDLAPIPQSYRIVNVYPHNENSFTQGLFYREGTFFEGSGQAGKSALRSYEPATGKILKEVYIPPQYFGEGIALLGDIIYQLTYKAQKILLYDAQTFKQVGERPWGSEGWGLTTDEASLILSDGSPYLYFLDPVSMQELRRVKVSDGHRFVTDLNELEYIKGVVYANVWETDSIISIDPATGKVLTYMDMKGILPGFSATEERVKVLNGIAYIPERETLVVTGKEWPQMFEISVSPPAGTKP